MIQSKIILRSIFSVLLLSATSAYAKTASCDVNEYPRVFAHNQTDLEISFGVLLENKATIQWFDKVAKPRSGNVFVAEAKRCDGVKEMLSVYFKLGPLARSAYNTGLARSPSNGNVSAENNILYANGASYRAEVLPGPEGTFEVLIQPL